MEKAFLCVSGIVSLSALVYTVHKGTKGRENLKSITEGRLRPDLQALISDPSAAQQNPKLAAYMFAGRAFGFGSAIALSATLMVTCGLAVALGAKDLKDFSNKSKYAIQTALPSLKGKFVEDDQENVDKFIAEWNRGVSSEQVNPNYYKIHENLKKCF